MEARRPLTVDHTAYGWHGRYLYYHQNGDYMTDSIFESVKKVLGLLGDDDSFDQDILLHINSVVSTLRQLGLSIPRDFYVRDDVQTWRDLLGEFRDLDLVKSYMTMKVRLMFDPPSSSFGLKSMEEMTKEFEWRINVLTDQPYSVPVLPSPEGSET